MPDDLRRTVTGPDGTSYEVVGMPKDWKLGTGSILLDVAAFFWGALRRAMGKEWEVAVRRSGSRSDRVASRLVRTREEAGEAMLELVEAIQSGEFTTPAD